MGFLEGLNGPLEDWKVSREEMADQVPQWYSDYLEQYDDTPKDTIVMDELGRFMCRWCGGVGHILYVSRDKVNNATEEDVKREWNHMMEFHQEEIAMIRLSFI